MRARSVPAGWLTAAAIAAVVVVNAGGIWGIAAARRTVRDEAARVFGAQTDARARLVEGELAAARTDLAFLAGSSAIARLGERPLAEADEEWGRRAPEAALLVFLRAHPEVKHLAVIAGKADALVEAGRRGGVPVLWRTRDGSAIEASSPEQAPERRIRAVVAPDVGNERPSAVRLVAEVDALSLLDHAGEPVAGLACDLRDRAGFRLLPPSRARAAAAEDDPLTARALVRADGWSTPSPWSLSCTQPRSASTALEPVVSRGRLVLVVNLAMMTLALLLGVFTVQQAQRRERVEARAREERHVRELEAQLFHAERLGGIGRLAAGLAHELNNPLEGMANYLAVARAHLSAGDQDAARQDLELVRQGLDRTAGIVRQVLAQANPASAAQAPLDIAPVVRQASEFVRSRPEFRGIDFHVDLPDDPLMVNGNGVMLGQVLLNLLRNACEAQPAGGEVRVRAGRDHDGGTLVEIADRGPGIPASEHKRVFEPFYSTKSSTGLGLSVCDGIVRQHQGRLEVRDREGGGALFVLSLPALRTAA